MKGGEIFTTERISSSGTGYRYAPVRLTGEVAILGSEVLPMEPDKCGGAEIQRFTFQCLRPGKAEIQLARFRSFEMDTVVFEEIITFGVEPATNNLLAACGSWTPFRELTAEDKAVFDKAMQGLVGVEYTPGKVSTQVVNGINYRFFCHGTPVVQDGNKFPAIVAIYAAPDAAPIITNIQRLVF